MATRTISLLGFALKLSAWALFFVSPKIALAACPNGANAIETENCLTGTPSTVWDVSGAGDLTIQGFSTDISVNAGQTISLKVDTTPATSFSIDIYRLGYYQGNGARKVATISPVAGQSQPFCLSDASTGLNDCGNWAVSASWAVPANAVSGLYIARLIRSDTQGASHIPFVVRNDTGHSDLLFQTSDTTWQAYNQYGGNSLYVGSPAGRAYKVSYNRPIQVRAVDGGEDGPFNAEYPMIRWLEQNGYDVSYMSGLDTARLGASNIQQHKVFMSVGHDEYWSADQRANVETARDAGVNLAFFSGNESFWKTRWEPSIDISSTPNRTLVCYKETHAGANIDPLDISPDWIWTGSWRDNRDINHHPYPENAMSGTIFMVNAGTTAILVPAVDGKMRLWRGTDIAALPANGVATLGTGSDTLGYEWDSDLDNGFRPAGLIRMSATFLNGADVLQDQGSTYASGVGEHHLTLYRKGNALVFGAGTVQWSWGLDGHHIRGPADPNSLNAAVDPPDTRMQQATVNLFADMGVQPVSPSGISLASASTDHTSPTSLITSPAEGALITGTTIISGTASDTGGGVVGGVEVSTDGGATWHRAEGRETWSYVWTPTQSSGTANIRSRAADDSANLEVPGSADPEAPIGITVNVSAPFTIFGGMTAGQANDNSAVELGVRFRSDVDGFLTGLRFYKTTGNTGTHTGSLWTNDGVGGPIATLTFTNETDSGWQEAFFAAPIAITANTTYVASYHTTTGSYAAINGAFNTAVDNPPLHALQNGVDGANGVYHYGAGGVFPTDTFQASNYLVDVLFVTNAGPVVPVVLSTTPANAATGVALTSAVSALFNENINPSTINNSTFTLKDSSNNPIAATVTYDVSSRTATLTPNAVLSSSTTYTATLLSGASGVTGLSGTPLAADKVWSFTTVAPAPPPADQGVAGSPVLIITQAADPFGRYYVEILQAEGLNAYFATDITNVDAGMLANYDAVILASMPLSPAQVTMFSDYVTNGGNLIAMRPAAALATLLGLSPPAGTTSEGYVLIDTSHAPGAGIVGETMQFHGTADNYVVNSPTVTQLATLYSNATTSANAPAVTLNTVGSGHAAAFSYDLARSIVYTRQGNPAYAGQKRDGAIPPIRSDDQFYPTYVDFTKIQIPQADEQQRFLANLIGTVNLAHKPLPRFWYFPRDLKAVVVMTGDDHANNGTAGRFAYEKSISAPGCSVANWQCVRSTSYVYPGTLAAGLTDALAAGYNADGFEIAIHPGAGCSVLSDADLDADFTSNYQAWTTNYPSLPPPTTNRTHCIAWSTWLGEPKAELNHGMRLDANYYYWPQAWILNRPGLFTGTGIPMRFADLDGTVINVYQATTQMPDESGEGFPEFANTLFDNALGSLGYYGAFTTNMHTDTSVPAGYVSIVQSAQARSIPIVAARQMLAWLDGRNGSSFGSIHWIGNDLNFTVTTAAGSNGLRAMLPTNSSTGFLGSVTVNGNPSPLTLTTQTIKGVSYAFFDAQAGNYVATYIPDNAPPVISNVATGVANADGTITITWTTDKPSTSTVNYGVTPALGQSVTSSILDTSHSVTLTGLAAETTYSFQVSSVDAFNNTTSGTVGTFTTPAGALVDTTVLDFNAGTGTNTYVSNSDGGEVILNPTVVQDFSGSTLPPGWEQGPWTGGGATVSGGALHVDGGYARTIAPLFASGLALEFATTFVQENYSNIGLANDLNAAPWALFGFTADGNLYARTNDGSSDNNTLLPASLIGSKHIYRIEWDTSEVRFYVDGSQVTNSPHATNFGATQMRPMVSNYILGGPDLTVDWIRMTPYAASGTFTSHLLDAGHPVNWGAFSWVTDAVAPHGTTLTLSVRLGNTTNPDDGSWTLFQPVSTSGSSISGNSRYLQYKAVLATTDATQTPTLYSVSATFSQAPDTTAPTVVSHTPLADETNVALNSNVTVTFSELMNPATISSSTIRLSQGVTPVPATVTLASTVATLTPNATLDPLKVYTVTISGSVADSANNPLGSDLSWNFTTSPQVTGFVDTTVADFTAGTPDANTYISSTSYTGYTSDGDVTLMPAFADEFPGTVLSPSWTSGQWTAPNGGATVSGGLLTVDGGFAATNTFYSSGHTLEFVGTFGAQVNQHAGFGIDLNNSANWAIFSQRFNGDFDARTMNNGSEQIFVLPSSLVGSPHLFKIVWIDTDVSYFVDGVLQVTHTTSFGPTQMRPISSDLTFGGATLTVDWFRMSPYPSSGVFLSRVFGDGTSYNWTTLSATLLTPAPTGTGVTFETRTGNSATPDGTWSAFAPLTGAAISSPAGTYLQYRATLTSSNSMVTPTIQRVDISALQAPPQAQTITFTGAPASAVFGSTFDVSASASSGLAVVVTASGTCSVVGNTVTMTSGTGSCLLAANQAGNANYAAAPTANQTTLATKASQTIVFTASPPATAAYNTGFSVAATGGASGNVVTFTSSGSCSNSGATYTVTSGTGTCSVIANQAGNVNYADAPQLIRTVNETLAAQTITFTGAPVNAVFGAIFDVSASSSSGLLVTITASGACSISGNTVTMTSGTGICALAANQAGDTNYSAAPIANQQTAATQVGQAILFSTSAPATAAFGDSFTVVATGGASGNALVFTSSGSCTNVGATYTISSGAGTCSVIANQAGDANYSTAPTVIQSTSASKAAQVIVFTTSAPTTAVFGDSFTVAATGGASANAVTFTSSGSCTNTLGTYTITSGTGTCSVIANQAGNDNYSDAVQVTQTVNGTQRTQTITFTGAPASAVYGSTFNVSASASSGLAVTLSASGSCSIAGNTVTMTSGIGSCLLAADQAGNANYASAPTAHQSTLATKVGQGIVFTVSAPATAAFGQIFTVVASGGASGNAVTFSSSGACTNSDGTYTITSGNGTCSVIVNQAGNDNYSDAPQVIQSVNGTSAAQTITFTGAPANAVFGSTFNVSASASSGLAVTLSASGACSIAGNTVTMTSGTGTCSLAADQAGNDNYSPAPTAHQSTTATKAGQAILFTTSAPQTAAFGSSFSVAATGGASGNPVTFTSSGLCTNNAGSYTITSGTGTCSVIADQAGDANYANATQVIQSVNGSLASQAITFTGAPASSVFGSTFNVSASASSGLAVTITASGSCSVNGNAVTMTSGTGTCLLFADQAGNENYAAASTAHQSTIATKAGQTILFTTSAPATAAFGESFSVAATGGASGNALTFTSSGSCTNSGSTYTITSGAGTCSVIADQAGDINYANATQVIQTVNGTQGTQTITFTGAPSSSVYGSTFNVSASASSGLPVSITTSGACSVSGNTVTMTSGTGTCSLAADQAGNTNYAAAPTAHQSTIAATAGQTILFTTSAPQTANFGTSFTVAATGGASGNAVTFTSSGSCTNNGATYTITSGSGTCLVMADQTGNGNYSAAPQVIQTVNGTAAAQVITFTGAPASAVFGATFNVSGSASSGIAVTITASGACSIAGSTVTMTAGTGTCSLAANQGGDANYLPAPTANQSTAATKAAQAILFTTSAPATSGFGESFTVAATGGASGNAVTFTSSGSCTNSGATYTITSGTGTCSVIADQAGSDDYADATQVIQVVNGSQAAQTITFTGAPASSVFGSTFGVSASASSGLAVSITASGSCSVAGNTVTMTSGTGTCLLSADQAGNANYASATTAHQSTAATKASQAIVFSISAPTTAAFGDSFTVAAAGGASGNEVTFTNSGSCSNAGAVYTITGTGICSVIADQAGDANYDSATQVTQSVNATSAGQTITFTGAPASAVFGSTFDVSASASSGLAVAITASGACSIAGNTVTMTSGTGTCSLAADQSGDANHSAAPTAHQSTLATKAGQAIVFSTSAPSTAAFGSSFTVVATGGASGNAVTFTSSGSCTNSGSSFTITGTGTCSVIADQAGNDNYSAAPQVIQNVNGTQAAQTITFTGAPVSAIFGSTFDVSASASSGLAVIITASGSCSILGNTVTMTSGVSSCLLAANQAGDANYSAAPTAHQETLAAKAGQAIVFTTSAPGTAVFGEIFTVVATGGASGNPVTFTSSGSCSNSAGTYTITSGNGTCSVIADQAGNDNYAAAPQVIQAVNGSSAAQTITFTGAPATAVFGSTFDVSASASSGLLVAITASGACSITANTVTMTSGIGTCSLAADQSGNANYAAAPTAHQSTAATKAGQAIVFSTSAPATAAFGATITVAATGGASANPVTFTSSGSCSNNAGAYTITSGTGACSVIADQAGNDNYQAAVQVIQIVNGTLASQAITFTGAPANALFGATFTVSASASSGLAVVVTASGACSVASNTVTMTSGTGTCQLAADQAGNANYAAATTAHQSTAAAKAGQTILFTSSAPATAALGASFTVTANGGASGNPVTFTSSGSCTNTGGTYTITDSTGTCSVIANQLGDANYTDAPQVIQSVTVNSAPIITLDPVSQAVVDGGTATFTSAATGLPDPTVQWQASIDNGASWQDVSGATSTTLSFTAVAVENGTQYHAVFTNSVGFATTSSATLVVYSAPVVLTDPTDATVTGSNSATFSAAASGVPAPTVQWQLSTDAGATWNNIGGATSTTLVTTGVNGSQYRAVFTNTVGSATTNAATLTVQGAPVVVTDPTNRAVNAGTSVSFTAAATGNPNPTVQWQVSTNSGVSFANIASATSTTYTFTATATQNGYQYRAVFSNIVGSATTAAATLTVNPTTTNRAPQITSANNATFRVGTAGTFTFTATGTPTPTLTLSGTLPRGLTFSAGKITGTPAAGTGGNYVYTVSAKNGISPNASQRFTLHVQDFRVVVGPDIDTATFKNTAVYNVRVRGLGGMTGNVSLSCTGNPTGTTCTLGATSVAIGSSTKATVKETVKPNSPRINVLTVTGTLSGLTHSDSAYLITR